MADRKPGYEQCPGCKAVEEGKQCEPRNAAVCPIAWSRIVFR